MKRHPYVVQPIDLHDWLRRHELPAEIEAARRWRAMELFLQRTLLVAGIIFGYLYNAAYYDVVELLLKLKALL